MKHSFQPKRDRRAGWVPVALFVAVAAAPSFAGEPMPRSYPFASTPLEIYDRLPTLKLGAASAMSDDERKLLAGIWDRNRAKSPAPVDDARMIEAMLFASGVEGAEARGKYRTRFEALVVEARKRVEGDKDDLARGETLMKFLHGGVMKAGYESGQSSFAAVFDTGKYNCVSSTAMYYLVGTRLGLELRAVSIAGEGSQAGHAALDMVDGGKRIQVEPTNPEGFDWQAKLRRPGFRAVGYVPDRKKARDVEPLGIAAMICNNAGVGHSGGMSPNLLGAARCHLTALILDPADATAAGNLLSAFVNGGPKLTAKKDYESATRVLGFGLTIDPKSGPLRNNHRIAWVEYIEATLEAGNDAEALAVARRAAEAVPGKDFASPSEWFVRHAENRLKKGWEEGLKVAQRGLVVLDAPERRKLLEWRSGTFRQWSQSLLRADDAEGSSAVLARAYALDPNDKAVVAGIGFHTQEALRSLESKSGAKAAVAHFEALRRDFPKVAAVGEMGASHANRSIRGLSDGGKFADALAAIETFRPLLPDRAQCDEVGGIVYDKWARQLVGKKSWKEALNKYAEGRKAFPKQDLLVGNAVAAVDRWGKTAIDAKKWDEAIGIYEIGLEYHPGNAHLLHNKNYCEKMKAKAK